MCEEYSNNILQVTIAKLLLDIGFKSVKNLPLHQLANELKKLIIKIGTQTKMIAEMENCSEPNILHVQQALRTLNIPLDGLNQYKNEFPSDFNPISIPAYPIPTENNLNFLRPGSDENLTRPVHVFSYLPPVANPYVSNDQQLRSMNNQDEDPPSTFSQSAPIELVGAFMISSGLISPANQPIEAESVCSNKRKRNDSMEHDSPSDETKSAEDKNGQYTCAKIKIVTWQSHNLYNDENRELAADFPPTQRLPSEQSDNDKASEGVKVKSEREAIPSCSYVTADLDHKKSLTFEFSNESTNRNDTDSESVTYNPEKKYKSEIQSADEETKCNSTGLNSEKNNAEENHDTETDSAASDTESDNGETSPSIPKTNSKRDNVEEKTSYSESDDERTNPNNNAFNSETNNSEKNNNSATDSAASNTNSDDEESNRSGTESDPDNAEKNYSSESDSIVKDTVQEVSSSESNNQGSYANHNESDTEVDNAEKNYNSDTDSAVDSSEESDMEKDKIRLPLQSNEAKYDNEITEKGHANKEEEVSRRKQICGDYINSLEEQMARQQVRVMRIFVSPEKIQEIKENGNKVLKYTDEDGGIVYICPTCFSLEDLNPMIFCDECNNWFHFDCVGLTVAPKDTLWYCAECLQSPTLQKDK